MMDFDEDNSSDNLFGTEEQSPDPDPRRARELRESAYQVYNMVWDQFYTWETEESQRILSSLTRKFDPHPPSLPKIPPRKKSGYHPVSGPEVQTFKVEDYDHSSSRAFNNIYDVDSITVCGQPGWVPYPRYTTCTPISHNVFPKKPNDMRRYLEFVPFADDEAFEKHFPEYLSQFHYFRWQKDFLDPDLEIIQFETARRLIEVQNFQLDELDELQVFSHNMRDNNKAGLLWYALQRDDFSWPSLNLTEFRETKPNFVNQDINESLTQGILSFCPRLGCAMVSCGSHAEPGPIPTLQPKVSHEKIKQAAKRPCGDACCKTPGLITDDMKNEHWDEADQSLFHTLIKYAPDTLPCDLALICGKPCFEMFIERQNTFREEDFHVDLPEESHESEVELFDDLIPPEVRLGDSCAHYGPCDRLSGCKCFENKRQCHRACRCLKTCKRRYKGCQCRPHPARQACCDSNECRCFRTKRQCDPEVCRSCDSRDAKTHYPTAKQKKHKTKQKCANSDLLRGVPVSIRISQSQWGLGAFALAPYTGGDIIGEYVGELFSNNDDYSDCFEALQKHVNLNYAFKLDDAFAVLDSWLVGNETRYLNDPKPNRANCKADLVYADGDHKLMIYALKNIRVNTELTLDYGEDYWPNAATEDDNDDTNDSRMEE